MSYNIILSEKYHIHNGLGWMNIVSGFIFPFWFEENISKRFTEALIPLSHTSPMVGKFKTPVFKGSKVTEITTGSHGFTYMMT